MTNQQQPARILNYYLKKWKGETPTEEDKQEMWQDHIQRKMERLSSYQRKLDAVGVAATRGSTHQIYGLLRELLTKKIIKL